LEADMTQSKDKDYKRKVVLVVSGVIFAFLLLIALIANLITLVNKNREIARLESEIAAYNDMAAKNEWEIEYRKTDEYIEDYARDILGYIAEGESAVTTE
jgi:cell division protein FtsB